MFPELSSEFDSYSDHAPKFLSLSRDSFLIVVKTVDGDDDDKRKLRDLREVVRSLVPERPTELTVLVLFVW